MNLRNLDRPSRLAGVPAKHQAFRLDINRASLLVGGLIGAVVSALYFTLRPEPVALLDEFVFGRHSRIGSIITIPIAGEHCRQAAFHNDSGVIVPLGEISCVLIIERAEADAKLNKTREPDKFAAISEKFRK